jgi:hypothetical protein
MSAEAKVFLLASSRIVLVATGYEHWFFGFAAVYLAQGMQYFMVPCMLLHGLQ